MPELIKFGDVEEVDNRYINKCIVYVEGKDDQNVWERIVGSELSDRLEFKVPLAEGTGSETVLKRVNSERPRNSRIFGLVDGEIAARFGEVARLIDCSNVLFAMRSRACDGILCLSTHELENVLVGHSCLAEFVECNVELKEIGSRKREEVEEHISKQAKRFYVAALIKYTWAHMYFLGLANGIGDVDHFRSDRRLLEEIRNAKQKVVCEFADKGLEFRRQLGRIGGRAKTRIDAVKNSGGNPNAEILRLADGKGLLIKLRNHWRFTKANEGLLVERVSLSDFADKFRAELVAVTGA